MRHGEGVFIYDNKDVYSGQWSNGQKEGPGSYIFFETGMKYVGDFKAGQMVKGEWRYKNGTRFAGNFDNNQPKGKGMWNFADGNKVEGVYKQVKRADTEDVNAIKLSWNTTSDVSTMPQ